MITKYMIDVELSTGLSFVCASCEHWHNAKSKKHKTVECGQNCGGPLVGMGFPKYKGPFENSLSKYCFICGRDSCASIEINNRFIGVCNNVGTEGKTCIDKLYSILSRKKVTVIERVAPVIY